MAYFPENEKLIKNSMIKIISIISYSSILHYYNPFLSGKISNARKQSFFNSSE